MTEREIDNLTFEFSHVDFQLNPQTQAGDFQFVNEDGLNLRVILHRPGLEILRSQLSRAFDA